MLNVMHFVSKMDRAGQETFIMNLFRKIDRSKIQFDFLCTDNGVGDYDEEIVSLGGRIYYIPPIKLQGPLKQGEKFFSLISVLRKHRCDVFHIHTHHAMDAFRDALAAKVAGIKTVVVHSHNTSALFHLQAHGLFKKLLSILPVRRFACSKAAGEWLFTDYNFSVIHNGLDVDDIYFREALRLKVRDRMGWSGKKIIGHVGRFNEQKNHRFIIEVFAEIFSRDPSTHLVLVGKGELEEEIRALVEKRGLTDAVSFLGIRDDVQRLYQGMDLFLFPSLFEGLGIVLIEAQACDLPCLVSDAIPQEAILTSRTVSKLTHSTAEWATEALHLLNQSESRGDNRNVLKEAGYDIGVLANNLEKVYLG